MIFVVVTVGPMPDPFDLGGLLLATAGAYNLKIDKRLARRRSGYARLGYFNIATVCSSGIETFSSPKFRFRDAVAGNCSRQCSHLWF